MVFRRGIQNQHTQGKLLNFENCCNRIKWNFQSQFLMSQIIGNILKFFSSENANLRAHFLNPFLFWNNAQYFTESKNLFNFVSSAWKRDNLYYNNWWQWISRSNSWDLKENTSWKILESLKCFLIYLCTANWSWQMRKCVRALG